MTHRQKILILTSNTGGGHTSLAVALRDRLQGDYEIEIIDPQPGFVHLNYLLVTRYALWLWAAEFRLLDTPQRSLLAHRVFTRLLSKRMHALLDRVQPDMVITTYPFLTYEVMRVIEQRQPQRQAAQRPPVAFVMLLADPNGVHSAWLTERNATMTFATSRETFEQATNAGFLSERLHLTGAPIREQFYRTDGPTRAETLSKLNLDPERFTIFLQGGGEGAGKFGSTVENVLSTSVNPQVILAVGTNKLLRERYQDREHVFALPFTREIAPYMAAADIVMGKAGPNAIFESASLGKPFVATAYIPGQEEINLEFIQRHMLGWVALKPEEQRELVTQLATNPAQLQAMSEKVSEYSLWNRQANELIAPLIHACLDLKT